jgi:hypothetical protein
MRSKRLAAVVLVAAVVILSMAGAARVPQSGGEDAAAGVLVGFQRLGEDVLGAPPSTLRTLWIRIDDAAPSRAARTVDVSDLLVPRQSGFWRVGRLATCSEAPLEPDEPGRIAVGISQYLWAVPLGRRPSIRFGPPLSASIMPGPERVGPCRSKTVYCDVARTVDIFWVAPDYVSIDFGTRGSCGAHGGWTPAYGVRRLDDVRASLSIGAVLGPEAENALRRAFERARAEYEKDMKACDGAKFDPATWWITREGGRWKTTGWSVNERMCNYGFDFSADIDVSRMTGRADDRTRWQTLHAQLSDINDVHVSPGGRWAIARTEQQLLVLDGDGARPALMLPLTRRDEIVMVEWATGRNVARWDAEVRRVHAMPPMAPIVVK